MEKIITLHDKQFSPFIESEEIQRITDSVAAKINKDMEGKNPLFIVVLNGAFMFAADLLKRVTCNCEVSFIKLSSYSGTKTTNVVREIIGLDESVKGRTIILIEDIIDTGITMANAIGKFKHMGADDVRIATLVFKPNAFQKDYPIDYIGMNIPNDFIVGYGLDYDGIGRNLPCIYKIVE